MAESVQLAKSIFSRTPDQETIVEDVYKKTDTSVVNSFQDLTGTSGDLYDKFSFLSRYNSNQILVDPNRAFDGGGGSLSDIIGSALPSDASKQKSLLSDTLGSIKSAANTVRSVTKPITSVVKTATSAYAQINGIVHAIKTGNLKDVRNITNTLNAVTGKTSVLLSPNSAVGSIYGSLVDRASAAGIADSFGIVAGAVKESTTLVNKGNVLYQMATTSMPGVISRGDYRSVASMVDNIGNGAVGMINPAAVNLLSKNNKTKYTASQISGADGQFVQYRGAYGKIDPNWNVSSWQPLGSSTKINDLSCLMDASPETKSVFSIGAKTSADQDTKWYSALDAFTSKKSVDEELKRRYPMSLSSSSYAMSTRDTDPRITAIQSNGLNQ
jgi:hypothetical protein